ncbi:hypothetical protein Hypma_010780 [Hypsizygus marmoreus]|uniref:Uncharacterized protein n=1 Tax=Hypsizygus marmoreus TaxID=39966 RepID=A0A369JJ56_HYPMA|nr:hypothetical protein Hypma_010780 [Hypsizygus marmoreus]
MPSRSTLDFKLHISTSADWGHGACVLAEGPHVKLSILVQTYPWISCSTCTPITYIFDAILFQRSGPRGLLDLYFWMRRSIVESLLSGASCLSTCCWACSGFRTPETALMMDRSVRLHYPTRYTGPVNVEAAA